MRRRGGNRVSNRGPKYEDRMELVLRDLTDLTYHDQAVKAAAMPHKVSKSPKILGDLTLRHRFPTARSVSV